MKNLPTLKGIFPPEQKPFKRDFLKENKLKLKDLQKHKTANNKCECQKSQQKSEQNKFNVKERIHPTIGKDLKSSRRVNSGCSCTSKKTCSSTSSTTLCYDKQTQTDDILDEKFLNDALKRCSSKTTKVKHDYLRLPDVQSITSPGTDDICGTTSNNSRLDHYQQTECDETTEHESVNSNFNDNDKDLETQIRNLHIGDSKESHKTLQQLQQHNGLEKGNKKSRSNIKIPKYLEREKREKELQKIHELQKDPNCPDGHYVLNENDRQEALKTAKNEFQKLVDELNHMPLSCQTLRHRRRKIEIEKSLSELEKTIQIFSKSKVYVPKK